MSIANVLSELWPAITQQQGQKVVQALVTAYGPVPLGVTNAEFAQRCIKRYIRAALFQTDRASKEAEILALITQNSADFPEV